MKIGMCLPYMKPGMDRKTMHQWCRRLDEGPFDSASCGERITGPTWDMRLILATAAALTERIRLIPSLYVLPMHDAVWAAKEIATLDQLSNGRVTVTVGVGGRPRDYRAVGASWSKRHQRMDEQVADMRRIWSGEPPFEKADPVGPLPVQSGGPPILIGAMGPKSMRRGAKWANGAYVFSSNGERNELKGMLDMAQSAWQEAGREQRPYRMVGFWYSLADDGLSRLKKYVYDYLSNQDAGIAQLMADSVGRATPDAVREAIDIAEEIGADELALNAATADIEEVDRMAELLAKRG